MKMTTSPKSEILNPKQSQNPKFKCFKLKPVGVLNFVHLNFEFISNFVLRASNFPAMMVFLFLSLFIPLAGRAGGPFVVNDEGVASTWDTSDTTPITIHPESGACATFSNDEMIDKIDENISVWSDIAGVSLSFAIVEGELGSVDAGNYETFVVDSASDPGLTDGLNPVIFDNDGGITDDIFGECNRFVVLGFAGPDAFAADSNFGEIIDAQGVFNCLCLPGNA